MLLIKGSKQNLETAVTVNELDLSGKCDLSITLCKTVIQ